MGSRRPAAAVLVAVGLLATAGGGAAAVVPASTRAPALSPTPPVALPTAARSSPPQLPRTGDDELLQAMLGAALLGAGTVVRIRARPAPESVRHP